MRFRESLVSLSVRYVLGIGSKRKPDFCAPYYVEYKTKEEAANASKRRLTNVFFGHEVELSLNGIRIDHGFNSRN